MNPPSLKKIPKKLTIHGDTRIDPYYWLQDKKNPDTLQYLNDENAYAQSIMKDTDALQQKLFKEMKARIQEKDMSVPEKNGDYFYYRKFLKGQEYPIYCRKLKSLKAKEEITLDCNKLAKGKKFFALSFMSYSPNQQLAAYGVDLNGSEEYTIFIKNLVTGKTCSESIEKTEYSIAWSTDNRTFFYSKLNENHRPDKIYRHCLGEDTSKDTLVYEEKDPRFFVGCGLSRSQKFIFIHSHGNNMSEIYFLPADQPSEKFRCIEPRQKDHEYDVDHHGDFFYIVTNRNALDFKIVKAPTSNPTAKNWKTFLAHEKEKLIENIICLNDHIIVFRREAGTTQILTTPANTSTMASTPRFSRIQLPEKLYDVSPLANPDFHSGILRFNYSSLITPRSVYDYDLKTKNLALKKQQKIPSGYNQKLYHCEKLFAPSSDGKKIPISLVYKKSLFKKNGKSPVYLNAYGSYGITSDVHFRTNILSLLNRGFVFAIAHIRGGQDLGRSWYKNGKLLKKKNTFKDFIACAEHLIDKKYAAKDKMVAMGGSAGGLLMGAIANMRPDLFHTIIAHVPFVDTLTTMLNDQLPLTTMEYNEWGNPHEKKFYQYIKSYSPYDNVRAKKYPHMLITAGLNDPRVTYWEPAKWTARLRELKTGNNLLLLKTNMGAGHQGSSGRFEYLKEVALEFAFILKTIQ